MDRQATFSDIEDASRRRTAKRDEPLAQMDAAIPWDALAAIVKPRYYAGSRGMKAHIGVDAGSGLVHTAAFTPANIHDVCVAHALVRDDDDFCYADSGYTGIEKRDEVACDGHLSGMDWVVAARPSSVKGMEGVAWEHGVESRKASVRSKAGHAFLIVKRQFSYSRCRYRGIAKNASALTVLFALANVSMWARAGCPVLPPAETPA